MTGEEIIASVLKQTKVSREEFFGPRRQGRFTEARVLAIRLLTKQGLSSKAIGRLICRDHATVLYWQKPEMRAQRSAYYRQRADVLDEGRVERRAHRAAEAAKKREAAAERARLKRAAKRPQKLRLSKAMSAEAAPFIRVEPSVSVPAAAIADASRRARVVKSVTGSFFGDPPPGYSALDRRNNAEARV